MKILPSQHKGLLISNRIVTGTLSIEGKIIELGFNDSELIFHFTNGDVYCVPFASIAEDVIEYRIQAGKQKPQR